MKELPSSQSQVVPEKKKEEREKAPEETKEIRSSGSVATRVYTDYFVAGTNWFAVIFMVVANIVCQALYSGSDIWLSHWTAEEEVKQMEDYAEPSLPAPLLPANFTVMDNSTSWIKLDGDDLGQHYFNLGIYGAIVGALCVISMVRTMYFFVICMKSSVKLHDKMFESIIRAPCRFFDTNPVGRILNRFSKDLGSMDELLPPALYDVLMIGLNCLGILAIILTVRPWVLLPPLALALLFVFLRRFYMAPARDIKRLEG